MFIESTCSFTHHLWLIKQFCSSYTMKHDISSSSTILLCAFWVSLSAVHIFDLKKAPTNMKTTRSKWWHKSGRMQKISLLCFWSFVVWKVDPHMFRNVQMVLPSKLSESVQSVWPSYSIVGAPQESINVRKCLICHVIKLHFWNENFLFFCYMTTWDFPISEAEISSFTCSCTLVP